MIYTRNSAKGIIISDGKILLLKKKYDDGSILYTLPGGTQEAGEILEDTVVREIFEEVAANVSVVKLLNIYEHKRISRKNPANISHKVEFAFLCQLIGAYEPKSGTHPDTHQVDVKWHNIDDVSELELSPAKLLEIFQKINSNSASAYLGDVSKYKTP
ncbi:MAG: NUDIX domain-containing protein [Gammaproteobacteria bacterium]|nr:NUDIX domain-containing protein [Gammaproteobacteria bacterium]